MRVPRGHRVRRELDGRLDDLASRDAEIVPLPLEDARGQPLNFTPVIFSLSC
jgi:hypothetical protein